MPGADVLLARFYQERVRPVLRLAALQSRRRSRGSLLPIRRAGLGEACQVLTLDLRRHCATYVLATEQEGGGPC